MEVQLNLEEIGKRLRRLREEKGITQSKLSESLDVRGKVSVTMKRESNY